MAYNRYRGNSGRVQRVETPQRREQPPPAENRVSAPPAARGGNDLLSRAMRRGWETEDMLVAAILYLAYRSGESEMLIALIAYLLL